MGRSVMVADKLMILVLCSALLAIPACKSGGGGDSLDPAQPGGGSGTTTGGPIVGPGVSDNVLGGWFVRHFDLAAVQRVRNTLAFTAQDLTYALIPPPGSRRTQDRQITANAYRDIGIDYARSVGLTGKGVTISIVDSPVNTAHADFAGKRMIRADTPLVLEDGDHGTGVAGVAAGRRGVAPRADLHHAAISFNAGIKLSTLAGIMRDAADRGALISNNSWALTATVKGNRDDPLLSAYASGRDYLDSLRDFTAKGIVVFAATNNHADRSAHLMAGLPALYPELERGWLAVINAIPKRNVRGVESAIRVSAACLEAARWCLAANGQVKAPSAFDPDRYELAKGASFAAPQIAGALALLAEAFPDLSAAELRNRLLVTADNGFFRHHGTVRFAPGLRHGYSRQWGHGFADLRAALLPIGRVSTTSQSGRRIALQDAVVIAGTAMGDQPARALAKRRLLVKDQMAGVFVMPAGTMVRTRSRPARTTLSKTMGSADLGSLRRGARLAATGNTSAALQLPGPLSEEGRYSIEQGYDVNLARTRDYRLSAILSPGGQAGAGLSAARIFAGERAGFELGIEALRESGSVMGMRSAARGAGSRHLALTAETAIALGGDAVLRFGGKIGQASGDRVNRLVDVGDQRFDSIKASLSISDYAMRGDLLTIFASQPVAVRSGAARISFAHPTASGGTGFSSLSVGTAPPARQIDLGLEYLRPVGRRSEMAFAMKYVRNDGNVAGQSGAEIGIRLSRSF